MRLFGILTERERNLVNKAITQERERIIKLLENKMFEDKRLWSKDFAKGAKWAIKETVELIKGEK